MLEKACQETGISPKKSVFYGNTVNDMLAGKLAGVTTAHFAGTTILPNDIPEMVKPDFSFQLWSDLLANLE